MRHAATIREAQPRRFVVNNTHELIQLAAVRVVATKGYHQASVRDICAEAHISARSFHEHFSGKEEAVCSGVEAGVDLVMGICREIYLNSSNWPEAVWDGLRMYAEWVDAEPAFTRTGIVEMLTIGPAALDLLHSLMEAFTIFLQPGYELLDPAASGSLDQAISMRVFELMYLHITEQANIEVWTILPEIARTILTPFMGTGATESFIAKHSAGPRDGRRSSRVDGRPTRRGSA